MSLVNSTNIELGEGDIFVKKFNGADQYLDLGGTGGADFSYKPSYKDIEIGQVMAPVKTVLIGEEGSFKVSLLESQMKAFALALGLDYTSAVNSSASADYIEFGGKHNPVYITIKYEVPQVDDTTKKYRLLLYKALVVSGLALAFAKGDERKYEVEFKLYANDQVTVGTVNALGKIEKER